MADSTDDQLAILHLVCGRLEAAGIAYMVTGSLAAAFYAQPRMTRDIDLVVELQMRDAARIPALFADEFLVDEHEVRRAIAGRGMCNLIHTTAIVKVDLIIRKATPYHQQEFQRRRRIDAAGTQVWSVSPEDLILSKLAWSQPSGSELQLRDARLLLRSVANLDLAYLERWAAELGISDLLQEAQS